MTPVLLEYQTRLADLHLAASQLRLGQTIAMTALVVAIAVCCALGYLSLAKRRVAWPVAAVPVSVAMYCGGIYLRRRTALRKTLRVAASYEKGLARLNGEWAGTGHAGDEFVEAEHEYARDLDVFGRGSLFELICTCRTQAGRQTLADYLLSGAPTEEAKRRQEAVKELEGKSALRERMAALGEHDFKQLASDEVTEWLEGPAFASKRPMRVVAFAGSASAGLMTLAAWDGAVGWGAVAPWLCVVLLLDAAIGLVYRNRVVAAARGIRGVGMELPVLRQGLELLEDQEFDCALLRELRAEVRDESITERIRRLERLTRAFAERDKEWFYLPSRVLLLGTQLFFAIERWKEKHGAQMRRAVAAWGEFEALMALAHYAHEHPENVFPRFREEPRVFEAKGMAHPLLPASGCVRNDVRLDESTRFYMISGSNMAGKSTMLRTMGLNAVLARAGAPVCAKEMELSRLRICASISVQDSLADRKSKFLAEMERIKLALQPEEDGETLLFLVDELLSGTNSRDRRTAAELILRAVVERGGIGGVSTHDLALTEIAELEDLRGRNMHMCAPAEADPLAFDYVLKPGIAWQTNALAIARLAGVLS